MRNIIHVPAITLIIAKADPHQYGSGSRHLTNKKVQQLTQRGPRSKSNIKAKGSQSPSLHPDAGKNWNVLTRHQQEMYIKQHPKTKKRITTHQSRKISKIVNKKKHLAAKPRNNKALIARSHRTLNSRQFARAITAKIANKIPKDAAAATAVEQTDNITQQIGTPKESPLKTTGEATQALFGHLAEHSDNEIIKHVNKHLSDDEKQLLEQAMQHAKDHPDDTAVPHKFRTVLTRTLIFALTVGVGAALLGPAGVLLAVDGIDTLKNKSGENLSKFAWRAFSGKDLKGDDVDKDTDKHEDAVTAIIKHLKIELANSEDEQQQEYYKSLIDNLDDRMDTYNRYLKPEKQEK
jgi:hypothetical protein